MFDNLTPEGLAAIMAAFMIMFGSILKCQQTLRQARMKCAKMQTYIVSLELQLFKLEHVVNVLVDEDDGPVDIDDQETW